MTSASLIPISGCGGKGPACFVVETGSRRLMLDLGYGPQPGLWPNVDGIGQIDALLLTHGHRDHAGGLALLPNIGTPPIYATDIVRRMLPRDARTHHLPLRGTTEICGISITTGRNGHAPGGVWIHLGLAGGLLYMGDYSVESSAYDHDSPPAADILVLDGSYGDYDSPLTACQEQLAPLLNEAAVLLPVPEGGRGPDIALHLLRTGRALPFLDEPMRAALNRLAHSDRASLRDGVAEDLAHLATHAMAIAGPRGVMLAGRADATEGEAARLIEQWERAPHPAIVFTGYLPPGTPAERLTKSGRAAYRRWNVHPRLSDNASLVRAVGARTVVPAFGEAKHLAAWQKAFAPATVVLSGKVAL